jgi:tRNA(Ile)-lysidine synthase
VLDRFLLHIEQHNLCRPGQRLLLAVSGGVDSMVMLHLFQAAGYSDFGVAHANFRLRGEESDRDEAFVREYCARHNIAVFTRAFDTAAFAQARGLSMQMAARELRYNWFGELVASEKFDAVATAHNLTDVAETILLRWLNGADAGALAGIPVKNKHIIRPLLFCTRQEVETYARQHSISWVEDSSNVSDAYARNYLRLHIIPHLERMHPGWLESVRRGIDKLKGTLHLEQLALQTLRQQFVQVQPAEVRIAKQLLLQHPHPYILYRLIREYGFSYNACVRIVKAATGQPGKRFLTPTHELVADRTDLLITPRVVTWGEVYIESGQEEAQLGPLKLRMEAVAPVPSTTSNHEVVLDAGKLVYPLRWRPWKHGDFFYPLGSGHRKKISDFLVDHKVPLALKSRVTVLESAGEIVWLVGHRPDDRYKITDNSSAAVRFTLSAHFA